MWEFLDKNIVPIFDTLFGQIGTDLQPVLETMAAFLSGAFFTAVDTVAGALKSAADWLGTLLDKIREWRRTDVPDAWEPGSPPPLYYALQDINSAIAEMSQVRLPKLTQAWQTATPSGGALGLSERMAGAMASVDRSAHVTVNANYANMQSESSVARDTQTALEMLGWR